MAVTITIDGVNRTSYVPLRTVSGNLRLGGEWVASFDVVDKDTTITAYRPTIDDAVVIDDGATNLFTGKIVAVDDSAVVNVKGTRTRVEASANIELTHQAEVTAEYAAGFTLLQIMVGITNNGTAGTLGIDVNPGMTTGPTMGALTFDHIPYAEAANYLATLTGRVWRYTASAGVEMFAVGDQVAAFSITAANRNGLGTPRWTQRRTAQYFNALTLRYGSDGPRQVTFTATGTGSVSAWTLDYVAMLSPTGVILSRGLVTENSADVTLGMTGDGTSYEYNASTNAITRTAGNLPNGHVITLIYTVMFPQSVAVTNATEVTAHGIYQKTMDAPDIFDKTEATTLATALVRQSIAAPKEFVIPTRAGFELPGNVMTVTYTDRLISGSYLIVNTAFRAMSNGQLLYTYTFVDGTETNKTATEVLRQSLSGTASASSGTISGNVLPSFSGHFPEEVIAHSGSQTEEVLIGNVGNQGSYLGGSGILFSRNPNLGAGRGSWAIVGDQISGDRGLLFQDRSQTALTSHTITMIALGTNTYAFRPATGVSWTLGGSSNFWAAAYLNALHLQGPEFLYGGGVISAAQLTADTNDWNPSGLSTARVIRFTTDARRTITGLTSTGAGQHLTLVNVGLNTAVFAHNSGSSSAANRIICPNEHLCTLHAGDAVDMWYDTTASLWRVVATVAPSGIITPAYSAGDFTASAGSWTVDAGDVNDYSYIVTDKMMTVWFAIITTDVSSAGAILRLAVPGGRTIATGVNCQNLVRVSDAGAAPAVGTCYAQGGQTYLQFASALDGTTGFASTTGDNTDVIGQITFPIA